MIIQSFNAGVLSPLLDGRSDLEKYYSGVRVGDNMIPLPYGPSERRPGTYFVCELKDNDKKARLVPFQYSTEQAYILEMGDEYVRFFKDRGQIVYTDISFGANPSGDFAVGATMTGETSGATAIIVAKVSTQVYTIKYEQGTWTDGEVINCGDKNVDCAAGYPTTAASTTPVEVSSDYAEADLLGLQHSQSADVLYNVHGDYPQSKLSRYSHDHWLLEDIVFDWPVFLAENITDITITPPTPPTDVTSGETFLASSEYNASYADDFAFDDILPNVKWGWLSANGNPTDQWIRCQFAAGKTITKIKILPLVRPGYPTWSVRHCRIDGSDNPGVGWTKIAVNKWVTNCSAYDTDEVEIDKLTGSDEWAEFELDNVIAYTYYRVWCYDNWGVPNYVGLGEIEMFESISTTYTASAPIFKSDHVGSYWLLKHPRTSDEATAPNKVGSAEADGFFDAADEVTDSLKDVKGAFSFLTAGTWTGEIAIERSYDEGATWHTLKTVTSEGDQNFTVPGNEEKGNAWYRARAVDPPGTLAWANETIPTLSCERYYHYGIIKVTEYTDSTHVKAVVIKTVGATTATKLWSEGAWSTERGYPVTTAFYEGRIFYAGTPHRPLTIWGSKVDEYDNMESGTLDDDPVEFVVDSGTQNMIRWLVGQEVLLIGTSGGEFRLGSVDPADAISPKNPMKPRRQTAYGSKEIQALLLANAVLFVDAQGRKVRGAQYIFEKGEAGGYDAPDYTMLAEHITESGIVDMAYQQNPYPILWAWRTDGKMIGMLFEPGQKVWGWFSLDVGGDVESVAVIPGVTEDEVWIIVKREINGVTKRYIEYFKPRDWGSDQADCFFVDSGLTFDGGAAVTITGITRADPGVVTATNTFSDGDQVKIVDVVGMTDVNNKVFTVANRAVGSFSLKDKLDTTDWDTTGYDAYVSGGTVEKVENSFSGLGHLEGETVSVLGDGSVHDDVEVSSGEIVLTDYFNIAHVGLPYTSKLMPMKLAVPGAQIRGKKKRIHQIIFSFYKTLGAKFGTTEGTEVIPFRKTTDAMGSPPPLFTGEKEQTFPGGYELNGDIYVEQTQPLPLTVRSIIAKLGVYG